MKSAVKKLSVCVLVFAFSPASWAIPQIEQWETANGARVLFVAAPEIPMVDVKVVFDAGSARDGEKSGLAALTNNLLDEGAGDKSADQMAESFESLGAVVGHAADRDMATLSLRSLNDPALLQPALENLALSYSQPRFEAEAFKRVQQQTLAIIEQAGQTPGSVAAHAFYRALYDKHPYASPVEGTTSSVSALTPEEIRMFHKHYYVAKNAVIAIVGALDKTQAEAVANTLTKQLPTGEAASALPAPQDLTAPQTIHIQHPSTQTHVLLGQLGVSRHDPDYFPLYVGNYVLGGGGFVSRLLKQVREKRGLAYSAASYFAFQQVAGTFIASLQTRNDQTAQALAVAQSVLKDFVENGVTEAELKAAKQHLIGGFPMKIDSNREILEYLAMIGFYRMPLDHLQNFTKKIDAVTLEQIKTAYQKRFHLDKFITLTVGNEESKAAVKSEVEKSGK